MNSFARDGDEHLQLQLKKKLIKNISVKTVKMSKTQNDRGKINLMT